MQDVKYTDISRDSLDEATEVLTLAFENDPFVLYILNHHGVAYLSQVRELFRFTCEICLDLGRPLIGTTKNTKLTGVASISVPEKKDWPTSLIEKNKMFNSNIGIESVNRLGRFSALSTQHAPIEPHHYLMDIGVHPNFQGQGLGRVLLEAVDTISESHPTSTGIHLSTTNPLNISLYKHFGYQQLSNDKLDDIVDVWFMFRPNKDKN